MLNLSDKDLDRLSQEAAQQFEPEDIGPKSWDKLEARLDRDLGKVNPNPARGIRRLPYFYAPVLLLILGVGYYFIRLNKFSKGLSSGSPPAMAASPAASGQSSSIKSSTNLAQSDKQNSTSPAPSNTVRYPGATGAPDATGTANAKATPNSTGTANAAATPNATGAPTTTNTPGASDASAASPNNLPRTHRGAPDKTAYTTKRNPRNLLTSTANTTTHNPRNLLATSASPSRGHHKNGSRNAPASEPVSTDLAASPATTKTGDQRSGIVTASPVTASPVTASPVTASPVTASPVTASSVSSGNRIRDLNFSAVGGRARLTSAPYIDDSALRAIKLNTIHQPLAHRDGMHINRSLILGVLGAPDFASVNSIAGDRAGSSFGLTVDYEFANHWYLGSGLLYSRRIFAAAPQDYHVPQDYYRQNGMGMGNSVQWIKGRFDMLEIPLDLRYDFSTTGNTLFFATAGASSYLFTREDCGYYYEFYNRILSKQFAYGSSPNNLFSTLNFSIGVETGISNSLSVLVSPYVKIPTRNIGFGQVQLNSFGIDFALRFAPILSRRR